MSAIATKLAAVSVIAGLLCGCASAPPPAVPKPVDFDKPVPASEPRAEAAYKVDLEPSTDCEERFDLALYRDRRVDLIQWDADHASCRGRRVAVRYLSDALTAAQLLDAIRPLTRKVEAMPSAETPAAAASTEPAPASAPPPSQDP